MGVSMSRDRMDLLALQTGPILMGILNLTPDSFSDGGRYRAPGAALAHALRMVEEGAQVIDVGGESTRPGATPVSEPTQRERVLETIAALRERLPARTAISIDTTRAGVAAAALAAGADFINDVSAGLDDPDMFGLAARADCPIVLMHRVAPALDEQGRPAYADVVREVAAFLRSRAAAAQAAGVRKQDIALDPGIGFGKRSRHNLALLARLDAIVGLGYPVLLGASRKNFMGRRGAAGAPAERVPETCATTALGVMAGVRLFRVHDVQANRRAADAAWAIREAR